LKVFLIAFNSMGVRSMATFIETSEGSFLVDPGASLAPRRYGLPRTKKS
jgi:predicted metallo-beta-lactamase superfamily hydrolase